MAKKKNKHGEAAPVETPDPITGVTPDGEIVMPVPPPAPIAGGGGPNSYQSKYNTTYYKSRRPELQPFFYGRPGAENGTELSQDEKWALADKLYLTDPSTPFDEEIEAQGWDPYATQYQRSQVYKYTRVRVGTGTLGPNTPVVPGELVGPVVAGYLSTSCDIKDYTPWPV